MAATLNLSRPATGPRKRVRKSMLCGLGAFLALVLAFLWYIGVFGGNVRVVEAGRFYRSGQLSGSQLDGVLRRYGIRSVINLRGRSKRAFYRSEVEVCRERDVAHYDVSMSAYRLPRPRELQALLSALDHAPRPTLIHCQQGADRSGIASTIYENVYEGVPLDRAEREQLTWRYGHFGIVGTWRLDRFFDLYRETASGQDFRTWISRSYPGVYKRATAR